VPVQAELEQRARRYGSNTVRPPKEVTLLELIVEALQVRPLQRFLSFLSVQRLSPLPRRPPGGMPAMRLLFEPVVLPVSGTPHALVALHSRVDYRAEP
jgi:hypothetical protein